MENREEHNAKLLGLVAFSRITAYARLARDVSQTTNFADQLALARLGGSFVKAIDDLEEFASKKGFDLTELSQPYVGFFDDMEARTRPRDWWERMVKSYVFVGILSDLETFAGRVLGGEAVEVLGVSAANTHVEMVRSRLKPAISEDPSLGARLSMWGRRVGGEAFAGVKNLITAHPDLQSEEGDLETLLAEISKLHSRRMEDLGLTF